jgi:type IV pilus assembly protein PilX
MRRSLHQIHHGFRASADMGIYSSGYRRLCQRQSGTVQRGTALVMSLIFLLILTILGVTAMTTSSLQEKMAGNLRDQFMAMESVESALRAGEQWLFEYRTRFGTSSGPPPTMCPGSDDPTDPSVWTSNCVTGGIDAQTDSWWTSSAVAYDSLGLGATYPISQVAAQPRYIIEFLQDVPDSPAKDLTYTKQKSMYYYAISGWSYGATQSARALLQGTFRKRFD